MMKIVIIIAIAFVLLIPSTVFAEPEIFQDTEVKYNACTERINRDVNELLKQQHLSGGSVIGYEGEFQMQLMSNCIGNFLYPLVDAGMEIAEDGRYEEAITYFDKALEIEPRLNDARMEKAVAFQAMGEHEIAIELFEAVHEQNPSVDVSEWIAYSEKLQSGEIVCGVGTVEKNGLCVPERASMTTEMQQKSSGGGCLIATATFGSELAPQVQQLREIRDNSFLQTESGRSFMESFNQFYYSFSPEIADLERENPVFKEAVKLTITPLLFSLSLLNYVDMDSEVEVLGYGISLILLNIGMYFVFPAIVIYRIRKFV